MSDAKLPGGWCCARYRIAKSEWVETTATARSCSKGEWKTPMLLHRLRSLTVKQQHTPQQQQHV
uniref:Uncharacterized protein n=1 Tax=Anopheles stephensi TaxID=30069 RepID=A0A182XW26_ANOST